LKILFTGIQVIGIVYFSYCTTRQRFDLLVEQMAKQEGVTEVLKAQEQMLWVWRMNCIRARAEEIVREEIIYCL
jgi:hypothetical protein